VLIGLTTVTKGRAMPHAFFLKGGKYIKINALDVTKEQKKKLKFFCEYCYESAEHTQGSNKKDSKPFFRVGKNKKHLDECFYAKKKSLEDTIREVGTPENLYYDIKPPLNVQKAEILMEPSSKSNPDKKSNPEKEKKPHTIVVNKDKKHNKFLLSVDDLFCEIEEIRNLEESEVKNKLFNRIIGKIYFTYSSYDLLIEKIEADKLKTTYFFIAGNLPINEFINLKDKDRSHAILFGKNPLIRLKIFPYNSEVLTNLKRLTWDTKNKGIKYEFIGLKASFKKIVIDKGITFIELIAYEFDTNQYRYM
jgi:hypothetical protein